jgi:hypothetical protein
MVLNHYAPNRRDTGSTSPRSVGEVALIRHTISHYSPVLIAPLSNQLPRAGVQKKKSAWRLVVATLRYLAFGSRAGPPVSIKLDGLLIREMEGEPREGLELHRGARPEPSGRSSDAR